MEDVTPEQRSYLEERMLKVSQFRAHDRCVHRPKGILAEPCGKQHKVAGSAQRCL